MFYTSLHSFNHTIQDKRSRGTSTGPYGHRSGTGTSGAYPTGTYARLRATPGYVARVSVKIFENKYPHLCSGDQTLTNHKVLD